MRSQFIFRSRNYLAVVWSTLCAACFLGFVANAEPPAKTQSPPAKTKTPAATKNASQLASTDSVHAGAKAGELWKGNSINMPFLWCPPGKFTMGSPKNEPARVANEGQVQVELTKGFWLGKYEVTQEHWRAVMNTEPWVGQIRVRIAPDSPACWINWDESHLFCHEFTLRERTSGALPEDWEYVLPTEAQWEYACRAGTTTKFSFGDDDAKLFDYAWYGEQERQLQEMNARAVGGKKPNPWGFYDIHGNVVEWCRDWYSPKYPGGKDPFVATDTNHFVTLRGGEWRRELNWSRSACRQNLLPGGRAATIGLRVALQPCEPTTKAAAVPTVKIAVVSFENRGTAVSYERLGHSLAGMLAGDLSKLAALDVLERQSAKELLSESTLTKAGVTSGNSAEQKTAFADYVLTGTCAVVDQNVTITASLSRAGIAKPQDKWTLKGPLDELFQLEQELVDKLVASLKISRDPRKTPPASDGQSPVMAILPFVNHSAGARLDDLQTGLAEIVQASLAEFQGVRLVERQQIDRVLTEQKLSASGLVDSATAVQIGRLLAAQRLLTGSFLEIGKQLSVQVRIMSATTGSVVASAQVTGSSDQFSQLVDELSRQIAVNLEIRVPEKADDANQPTAFGRNLEAALHASTGDRNRREGNLAKAAKAYQEALLVEPSYLQNHVKLMEVFSELNDYEGVAKTCEQALQFSELVEFYRLTDRMLTTLAFAYSQTGRADAVRQLLDKHGDRSDAIRIDLTANLADALIKQRRYPDAVKLMEQMAEKDVAKHGVLASQGLRSLYHFYRVHTISVVGIPIKDHQIASKKVIEVYERVLEAAKGSRDKDAADWARLLIPWARDILTISDANQRVSYLIPQQKAAYEKREKEVFGWIQESGTDQPYQLAVAKENEKLWAEAVDAYRGFLNSTPESAAGDIQPDTFGHNGGYYFAWIDKQIESQYRIAFLLATQLDRKEAAIETYQELVRRYGLSHFAGPDALAGMHELDVAIQIPADSALVWGGSTSNFNGWGHLLAAENLQMHPVQKSPVTLADLAPYRLVVLNRARNFPLRPSEVLALRTYVSGGGSLLVIASPQWDSASPILLNNLLSMFGMEADTAAMTEAKSTRIVPHPITQGITSFAARQAVGLHVPQESALIQAGGNTVLAATQFRRGRVVVASIGQWFTPEILLIPENETLLRNKQGANAPNYEFYRGLAPEPPLLRQTIRWLAEVPVGDTAFEAWQRDWRSCLLAFAKAQARIMPPHGRLVEWRDVPKAFDELIRNAPDAALKEVSLWSAGSVLMEDGHFNFGAFPTGFDASRRPMVSPVASRITYDLVLASYPEYFQTLVDEFRDSPFLPEAKLRLADTLRMADPRHGIQLHSETPAAILKLASPYRELDLKPGTYAHAWSLLHRALLYFAADDWARAAVDFDEVANSIPVGAEKEVALINAAKCHAILGDMQEARRRVGQLDGMPNINWREYDNYLTDSDFTHPYFGLGRVDTRDFSNTLLKAFDKMENDPTFESKRADRQKKSAKKRGG